MANPSCYYNWSFPDELDDTYSTRFASGIQAMDTSIYSLSQLFGVIGATTVVISVYPPTPALWATGNNAVTFTSSFTFASMSVSPYGDLTGAVTVPYSGCIVRFELTMTDLITLHGAAGTAATPAAYDADAALKTNTTLVHFRLLAGSLNISGDSMWKILHRGLGEAKSVHFTAIASLGQGIQTVKLEARGISYLSLITYPSCWHQLAPKCPLILTATMESI